MNEREKRLAMAVGLAVGLWLANRGWANYRDAVDDNSAAQAQAAESLADAKFELMRSQRAQRTLRTWTRQSLPTNRNVARSLYQDWLRNQLSTAGLAVKELDDNSMDSSNGDISEVSFTVRAGGTLAAVTTFLHEFYAANHLHRISSSSLATTDEGEKIDLSLTIDGLILADCPRSETLAPEADPADKQPLDKVQATIVERNVFKPYQQAAKTEVVQAEATDDVDEEARAARVTGMTYGGGGWLLSITKKDATSPELFRQGDRFQIGQIKGRITELDGRRVVFETDEGTFEIRGSQSFAEATKLESESS